MKKIFAALMLSLAVTAFSAGAALAQQILIGNGCDFPLHGLALMQDSASEGENLLTEPLLPGEGLQINLHINKGISLVAVDNEGNSVTFEGLDLSSASKLILHADGTATIE